MKFKFQKVNFLILFLLFITFFVIILRKAEGNQTAFFLYLFLSVAVSDLTFEAKKDEKMKLRQTCWIILNAMVGSLLTYDTFCQKDILLFWCFIFWTLFTTIINCIILFKNTEF